MREAFLAQLEEVRAELAELCALTGSAIDHATHALLDADLTAADRTVELNAEIARSAEELEHRVLTLLALQAPVAQDLRALISGIHNIADLRRMGTLAAHIAEVARLHYPNSVVSDAIRSIISDMGAAAKSQAAAACDVLRTRDEDGALKLIESDDRADELLRRLFAATKSEDWPHDAASTVNLTLLGRFYERFCDHTVEISRRTVFVVTGSYPEERSPVDASDALWLAPPRSAFGV